MDGLVDAPAFVVIALTLAAVLLLVEVALPTFGVAGVSGIALLVAGGVTIDRQEDAWWPLSLVAIAVGLWAVLLVRREAPAAAQAVAVGLYAVGGVGYGIAAGDVAAVVVAVAAAAVLAVAFPPLFAATVRLLDQSPQVGMEALVGRHAVVTQWDGYRGTVQLEGSLWNASAARYFQPGDEVLVAGYDGMMLQVTPVIAARQ